MNVNRLITTAFWCLLICLPLQASSLPVISDIVIEGNSVVKTETILHHLAYRKGSRFDETKSSNAINLLYNLGSFSQIRLEKEDGENDTVTLYVTVTERPTLTGITFQGNSALSDKRLKEIINADKVSSIDFEIGQQLATKMLKEYREQDYHHVKIVPQVVVDPANKNKAQLHFTITEKVKTHIRRINFVGNTVVPGRILRTYLQNRENWVFGFLSGAGKLDNQALEIDKERVRMVYADRGYFGARVTDTQTTYSDDKKDIDITFTIQEGPQFTIKEVDISPDKDIPEVLVRRCLTIRPGQIYKQSELHTIMESIKKLYGEYGYIDAHVAPQVVPDTESNTIAIKFHIDKGKKWRLNRVLITGNETTRDHVIRRQIMLEEGALITGSMMDASKRAVEYLSYFERDGITWEKHQLDNDLIDLELKVKEAPSREFSTGIDFGPSKDEPNAGLKGFFNANLRNMFGQGWDSGLVVKGTKKGVSQFSCYATDPYLFNSSISGSFNVSYSKTYYDQWKWVSPSPHERLFSVTGRLGTRLPGTRDTSMFIEAGFENIKNNNTKLENGTNELSIVGIHSKDHARFQTLLDQKLQPGTLEWLGVDIVKDTRNHMMYPNDGYRVSFSSKIAPPGLNQTFNFVKATLDASWYTPLIGRDALVLGLHAKAGYVEQIVNGSIPYRELFHLGGQNSIRGFNWGQVGPSWDYANPLGGKKSVQLNAELVFPLLNNYDMKVHLFYDAGCAWDTPKTPVLQQYATHIKSDAFNLRHTIGIGLNITKPQPIKLSFGYKLDRNKKVGETPHEFHIGMNTAF